MSDFKKIAEKEQAEESNKPSQETYTPIEILGFSPRTLNALINGGIGSVSRWKNNLNYEDIDDFVEQIPYTETQNYVKKVYKSYWNYLRIYDGVKF